MYEYYKQPPPVAQQKKLRKELKRLYESIPETEGCLANINKDGGCGAWCCEHQTPNVMYAEFLNTMNAIEHTWKEDDIISLVVRCVEAYFNNNPTKGCVFWDRQSKQCLQHQTRPFNCRVYGQTPDEEFKPRFEKLKVLYAENPNAVIREQCNLVKSIGKTPTTEDTAAWFHDLKMTEMEGGIHPDQINANQGGSYLTYHDHILIRLCTTKLIEDMTVLKISGNKEKQDRFIRQLVAGIRKKDAARRPTTSTGKGESAPSSS